MTYGRLKACEFAIAARRITHEALGAPEAEWTAISCWLDKVCVDPGAVGSRPAPEGIERIVQRADQLIVLLSWNYFSRLWCLFEWAVFLCSQPATSVFLRMVPLQTGRNTLMWVQAIQNLSVKDAACELSEDKRFLEEKVGLYFKGASLHRSFRTFERFVQFTAIAVIATANTEYLGSERTLPIFFDPWIQLAKRLEFHELAAALSVLVTRSTRRPDLPLVCWWHQEATLEAAVRQESAHGVQHEFRPDLFRKRIRAWFDRDVIPLIEAERNNALRPAAFALLGPNPLSAPEADKPAGRGGSRRPTVPRTALHGDPPALACANEVYTSNSDVTGMDFATFLRIHDQVIGRVGGLRIEPHVFFSDPAQLFGYLTNARLPAEVTRYVDGHRHLGGFALGAHQFMMYASAVLQAIGRREYLRRFNSLKVSSDYSATSRSLPTGAILRPSNSVPTMSMTHSSSKQAHHDSHHTRSGFQASSNTIFTQIDGRTG